MKERYKKYDKHGNVRPFPERPFVDELTEKEHRDELLLSVWRNEKQNTDQSKNMGIIYHFTLNK